MDELDITSISSHSPQARGRIERLWGTFQDRLVSELRLTGASTVEETNHVLRDFLPCYTQRFAVPAAQPGPAYRQTDKGFLLDQACCFKYLRPVGPDNVVRFGKHRLQILLANGRSSYPWNSLSFWCTRYACCRCQENHTARVSSSHQTWA